MSKRILTEEDAFPVSDSDEQTFIEAYDEEILEFDKGADLEVLRIEENLHLGWRGVRGCSHQHRVNAEAKAALERWVKDKMFQYRDLRLLRYGSGRGRVRCGSGGGRWGSKRWCGCSGSMPCYVEFLQH